MLTAYPGVDWQNSGLTAELLAFVCLPSLTLHPSRLEALLPASAQDWLGQLPVRSAAWRGVHRRWSDDITRTLNLPALQDTRDPALQLALLPDERWQQLQTLAGATLLASPIRRCINRSDVAKLRASLGQSAYEFALFKAPAVTSVTADITVGDASVVAQECPRLGAALLARALQAASAAVSSRANLRLPAQALADADGPQLSGVTAQQALAVCTSLIQHMDPTWHSLFPATR